MPVVPPTIYKDKTKEAITANDGIFTNKTWPIDDGLGSIAARVISSFGLETGDISGGSSLPGYDIYQKDAYGMIQLSLAADALNGGGQLKECHVNNDGEVYFATVGKGIGPTDIYYDTSGDSYKPIVNNVIVTGCEIPPKRETREAKDLFEAGNTEEVVEIGPWYHVLGDIVPVRNTYQEGWIEYNRLLTGTKLEAAWEVEDFESIITFAYTVEVNFFEPDCTDLQFRDSSTRYYELEGFGEMQKGHRLKAPIEVAGDPSLIAEGVEVPESDNVKFIRVSRVLIYGYKLNRIVFYYDENGVIDDPYVYLDTLQPNIFELRRGDDYVINKEAGKLARITFATNVVNEDNREFFGKKPSEGEIRFKVHPESIVIPVTGGDAKVPDPSNMSGKLKDGITEVVGGQAIDTPSVFPLDSGEVGYAVKKIFVEIEWDNPCVYIKDSRDIITQEKLKEEVKIDIYPIIVDDQPAPMAINGTLIEQEQIKPDDDPSTTQLWRDTSQQDALDSLNGADKHYTLPFLGKDEVAGASQKILDWLNENVPETTYICGPGCNPDLGATYGGGVVNDITYSYQDRSKYTVSVHCGATYLNLGSWPNSFRMATVEQKSLDGYVIQAGENNTDFIVNVNKIGQVACINATKEVIANGDKVKVTIYNNPTGE